MGLGRITRIVVAPQSLKGSLDAPQVGEAIARGIRRVLANASVTVIPVADGGEGTVRALVAATGGQLRRAIVSGPLGAPVEAEYGILGAAAGAAATAVVEMASASGLPLVPAEARDPGAASTFGTGELMRAALDAGCGELLIGIGGSATNDGGAGMAQALGARLLDAEGHELPRGGLALGRIDRIDVSGLDARIRAATVRVACDVSNPLLGPTGATAVYGAQKGVTPDLAPLLDAALARFAATIAQDLGVEVAEIPGAGAAGGLGAGLLAFAGARLVPGAELVLDALQFTSRIAGADLVITAEGQLDAQTRNGKSVGAVARAAHDAGARVIALAGRVALSDADLEALGLDAALPIADGPLMLAESMARAAPLLEEAAARAVQLVRVGQELARRG
jgi:glycerate kinase